MLKAKNSVVKKFKKPQAILFSRVPVLGKVKTRLSPLLDDENILSVFKHLVKKNYGLLAGIAGLQTIVYHGNEGSPQLLKELLPGAQLVPQEDVNFTKKMFLSMRDALSKNPVPTILIGSDVGNISEEYIAQAYLLLEDHDVVIGPSLDSGYCLIGVNPDSNYIQLYQHRFEDVLKEASKLGLSITCLPYSYDIDTPSDLLRYVLESGPVQQIKGSQVVSEFVVANAPNAPEISLVSIITSRHGQALGVKDYARETLWLREASEHIPYRMVCWALENSETYDHYASTLQNDFKKEQHSYKTVLSRCN